MTSKITIKLLFVFCILFSGCTVNYSFTGVNIDAETITISNFFNDADNGPPDLAQVFTDNLRDYYQRNTSLQFVDSNGDLLLEGSIVSYRLTPAAATAGNTRDAFPTSDQTRLTIVVSASFTNVNNDEFDFSKNFQAFQDFDSNLTVADVEEDLIKEIYDQIILNIFNESVANW
ncbi:MAG: LPS assembly lipoprotein LptE [Cyclobacteriaceae bacterium]|nr:LPS assembly lipoprotein LptE [Cyclobacteriaceae bacterium]